MQDLYFEENYGRLYEEIENGECQVFEFEHSLGVIRHMFIKRKIPILLNGETYYDLITPYGYGGPLIVACEEGRKKELVQQFQVAFQHYCKENNIVSEFVRFHPIISNAQDFIDCYEVKFLRSTIKTDLSSHEDPILMEYSSSCRRDIRRALKEGVEFRVTQNPPDLEKFKTLYYSTMERNQADTYYYFDDIYFSKCLKLFGEKIVLIEVLYKGQTIGMGLNFIYNKLIHAHLTGTLKDYHHLFPANILQYGIALWGKEQGFEMIHHGGGRTNRTDDSLYLFKKKFGRNTDFEFYVGEKIWNEEIYDQLCIKANAALASDFFPAYRKKISLETNKI
ncbi:GNAT family N-acetyltransferase [Planococcus shixiaomingii]|uniref:GNAT family N-acetyltransferase n=1 Tax=Planococcus shixiaomingii TaxID=3058393 RepID=UPI002631BFEF|nr:GNAT family N-acetyltransferase [Planococcus sp. N022]WKA53855.1 GNAT family N-acetyltransferase [Planococcus sp. N022]